jgi:hypothetical protein
MFDPGWEWWVGCSFLRKTAPEDFAAGAFTYDSHAGHEQEATRERGILM